MRRGRGVRRPRPGPIPDLSLLRVPAAGEHAVRDARSARVRRRVPGGRGMPARGGTADLRRPARLRLCTAGAMWTGRPRLPERYRLRPARLPNHLRTNPLRRLANVPDVWRRHVRRRCRLPAGGVQRFERVLCVRHPRVV